MKANHLDVVQETKDRKIAIAYGDFVLWHVLKDGLWIDSIEGVWLVVLGSS